MRKIYYHILVSRLANADHFSLQAANSRIFAYIISALCTLESSARQHSHAKFIYPRDQLDLSHWSGLVLVSELLEGLTGAPLNSQMAVKESHCRMKNLPPPFPQEAHFAIKVAR